MESLLPYAPFVNIHHEFSKKFDVSHEMICAELSLPALNILHRHEFISNLQMLLRSSEAAKYTPVNYYWHTRIDDLLSVYSLHLEILTEDEENEDNSDDNLNAKDELFDFWENCELAQPFQEKIKTLSLIESSEFVLALFEQNLLGFFYLQISKSPNMIDSLIYPITMEVGDSRKQIYLFSRDQLVSFDTPSETFPVVVIKDFLPTLDKVSYLDKGKWFSADVAPSGYNSAEIGPIKIIHQGQLQPIQYAEAIASISNALKQIRSADQNLVNFVCVFISHLCITTESTSAINAINPVPGISHLFLEKSDSISLAVKILQASALHFLSATLMLDDFVIDDSENIYFDVELNTKCSILDILRNIQTSYWPFVFLLKIVEPLLGLKDIELGLGRLLSPTLELYFMSLIYEDYIEHAFQTYKITQGGKDFCEKFVKSTRDASSKIRNLETLLQNKFPDENKKLQQRLENLRSMKKKYSLNH